MITTRFRHELQLGHLADVAEVVLAPTATAELQLQLPYRGVAAAAGAVGSCNSWGNVEVADVAAAMSATPTPTTRLGNPDTFLSRTDLRELGLERRAVDAVFRALPVVALPGYSRPLVRVGDYLALLERSTYNGDRVR